MRSTSPRRRPGPVSVGAAAVAALLVFAFLSSASVSARGQQRDARRASDARVRISEFAFRPPTLRVKPGTRVVFANDDATAHTATRRGGFETGRIRPGRSASVRLQRAGVYAYHCSIHRFMRGKIVVR